MGFEEAEDMPELTLEECKEIICHSLENWQNEYEREMNVLRAEVRQNMVPAAAELLSRATETPHINAMRQASLAALKVSDTINTQKRLIAFVRDI